LAAREVRFEDESDEADTAERMVDILFMVGFEADIVPKTPRRWTKKP